MSKRKRKTGRTGGSTRHPNSLANLIPGGGAAGPDNLRALTHGAISEQLVRDVTGEVRELLDSLAEAAPVKESDGSLPAADTIAVERAARALKRYRSVSGWLDLHGRLDDKGEVRNAANLELACERELGRALDDLGMTPMSRSKLGLRLVQASAAVESAEADRAARERLDRRLQALDGTAKPVLGDQKKPDTEPEGDDPQAGFAFDQVQDPVSAQEQSEDDERDQNPVGNRAAPEGHGRKVPLDTLDVSPAQQQPSQHRENTEPDEEPAVQRERPLSDEVGNPENEREGTDPKETRIFSGEHAPVSTERPPE